ncbi:MAG: ATP-binding protein, partial [Sedimentisphaerales bacterium]|nr:ATP-binding protein [Sedimentisphaerales bacterium]
TFGSLSIYSKQPDPFSKDEVKFLTELANDLAYSITMIRMRAAQRQAEETLRQNREDLSRAQAVAHIGSWRLDVRRNALTWSDENHRIFGIPKGMPLTYETFLSIVHPDDREYVDAKWKASLAGEDYDIEHRLAVNDKVKWVREKAYLEFDKNNKLIGGFGITQDITERKLAEETLANERANLQTIFDAVDVGMLLVDESGEVKRVNNAVARWISKDPSAICSDQPGDVLGCVHALNHPAGCGRTAECRICLIRDVFETAIRTEQSVHNVEAEATLSLNGNQIHLWLEVSADPLVIDGKRHIIMTLNNINARKQAEAALRENELRERARALELERLGGELAHKNEELESIIRIASHDLRSPLMNIKGFSGELSKDIAKVYQMLKEIQLPEKISARAEMVFTKYVPEALGFIQGSAESINRMLASLMQVAKAGTIPINMQNLDMNAIVADIAANYQFRLIESGGTLTIEPLPNCLADADQITQVFSNLIGNAIKYREPKRPTQIHVRASADDGTITYCVEDNGKGIDAEHYDKVFNLFTRLDPEAAEGEGIGLTIVKRMVERHGGKIWVRSEVGKGSTFFVTLPK